MGRTFSMPPPEGSGSVSKYSALIKELASSGQHVQCQNLSLNLDGKVTSVTLSSFLFNQEIRLYSNLKLT